MAATIATKATTKGMPTYRLRKGYSQAVVTLKDAATGQRRDYWLGEHGSPASYELYHRLLAEWESNRRLLPKQESTSHKTMEKPTVVEIIHAYKPFVQASYKRPSQQTIFMALRVLRQFYGMTPAEEFGPKRLRLLREQMIKGDAKTDPPRKPWSRPTINKAVHQILAMFKWAAAHEMLSAAVYQQLKTLPALRRGRSEAQEPQGVGPVAIDVVNATKAHLNHQVKTLVDLQLLTGARGGELFKLRPIDLHMDTKKGIWTIQPDDHKAAHHGHKRVIYVGPKAQAVIRPFLVNRAVDEYMFSPMEAETERRAALAAKRKTPIQWGNSHGTNRARVPKRQPGPHYTAASYRRAIDRACAKAGIPNWNPHQLRHAAATEIRREFGLEAARIVLGHSSALVTDAVYAERDFEKASEIMRRIG